MLFGLTLKGILLLVDGSDVGISTVSGEPSGAAFLTEVDGFGADILGWGDRKVADSAIATLLWFADFGEVNPSASEWDSVSAVKG